MKVQEGPLVHIKVPAHPRSRFMRKGCDGEEKNNGENSGLLTSKNNSNTLLVIVVEIVIVIVTVKVIVIVIMILIILL